MSRRHIDILDTQEHIRMTRVRPRRHGEAVEKAKRLLDGRDYGTLGRESAHYQRARTKVQKMNVLATPSS